MKLQMLLSNIVRFLGDQWDNVDESKMPTWVKNVLKPILEVLDSLLLPIIILLGTAGMIYGIILGVQYAKAETADKRDENKKHMIHAIIGIIIMLVLLISMKIFTSNADGIFGWVSTSSGDVSITIEIGQNKQTEDGAAAILVNLGVYDDQAAAKDYVMGRTRIVVSMSQSEWSKVSNKPSNGNGVTVSGVNSDSSSNSFIETQHYWVEYQVV